MADRARLAGARDDIKYKDLMSRGSSGVIWFAGLPEGITEGNPNPATTKNLSDHSANLQVQGKASPKEIPPFPYIPHPQPVSAPAIS